MRYKLEIKYVIIYCIEIINSFKNTFSHYRQPNYMDLILS